MKKKVRRVKGEWKIRFIHLYIHLYCAGRTTERNILKDWQNGGDQKRKREIYVVNIVRREKRETIVNQ